jgi:hypothetical protein
MAEDGRPSQRASISLPSSSTRHPDDLAGLRGRLLLRWAQAQVVEDVLDRELVGDVGHDLERTSAAFAHERVRLIDLRRALVEGSQGRFEGVHTINGHRGKGDHLQAGQKAWSSKWKLERRPRSKQDRGNQVRSSGKRVASLVTGLRSAAQAARGDKATVEWASMNREDVPAAIRKLADRAAAGRDHDPDHRELADLVDDAEDQVRQIRATTSRPEATTFADELEAAAVYARKKVWPKKASPPDDAA